MRAIEIRHWKCSYCKKEFQVEAMAERCCPGVIPEDVRKIEKIPIKDRRNDMHMILIRHYGGVKQYLLTMGKFKDIPLDKTEEEENEKDN